jgi:hypothetical protein
MAFPRITHGAVPIVDRKTITLGTVTTSVSYGSFEIRREGFIRRVRAELQPGGSSQPFELSLYETNPEGSDGTDGVSRIVTYRVTETNVGVFPASDNYILDSEEDIYYQLSNASKVGITDTMYYSIKSLGSTATAGVVQIEVLAAGGTG